MKSRVLFIALLLALLAALLLLPTGDQLKIGVDFFPLYFAARLVLAGLSPYGSAATLLLKQSWDAPFVDAGVAYPLPMLLLVAPLTALPAPIAARLWIAAGLLLALLCVASVRSRVAVLVPLLWFPLWWATLLGQATLLWFGLSVLLVLSVERRWWFALGISLALLPLKPQNGLLFALYGCWWAWREERRALLVGALLLAVLSGASYALLPGWLSAWIAQARAYSAVVQPLSLLPGGVVLLLACWRLPWYARIAALQTVLFPLSDFYSTLPLLLVWLAVAPPASLLAVLSWLWVALPNSMTALWLVVMLPLIVAAGWQSWREQPLSTVRA